MATESAVPHGHDLEHLATVTVTFHPDLAVLARQLDSIPGQCLKIVVDNHSAPDEIQALQALLAGVPRCRLVTNERNAGLAHALNQGAALAIETLQDDGWLLFLDQDSEPAPGAVAALLGAHQALQAAGVAIGAVGPALSDDITGLDHGFHQSRAGLPRRRSPAMSDGPVPVANVNGSGILTSTSCFSEVGGFVDEFFIDHVDTEWTFRVRATGRVLFGVPAARFIHRMGADSLRIWWFGWRVWPYRSPIRHYYLFRNTVRLMRMSHAPMSWKLWAPLKLMITMVLHGIFDPKRGAQLAAMLRGLRAGLA